MVVAAVSLIILFGILLTQSSNSAIPSPISGATSSDFDADGRYILRNYDQGNPMSSFLPGLGGLWGIPMWAFYVNRGQAITSFGIQNKDNAIMKFYTADKAYQNSPFVGFRTFLKGSRPGKSFEHMPFFPNSNNFERDMMVGMNELEIEERADSMGLKTNVLYYVVTDEDFPGLVRKTSFTNTDRTPLTLEVLDGMARLIPSGLSNGGLDQMGRTMEAWMNVYNIDKNGVTQPFYHISQGTQDTAQVQIIQEGHFALSFMDKENYRNPLENEDESELIPFIVDPSIIFGTDTTLSFPKNFFGPSGFSVSNIPHMVQTTTSRTPCAFAGKKFVVPPGKTVSMYSVYGHAENLESFVSKYAPRIRDQDFVTRKQHASRQLVELITDKVSTFTGSQIFDSYVKQNFLDNILRGGMPIALGNEESPKIYHTFSRIHGDIERDYNFFQIDTTYFAEGPGNFRDVNQNRRSDIFHTPEVGDFNIRVFMSLIQADGYNPLTVATSLFKISPDLLDSLIPTLGVIENDQHIYCKKLRDILAKPFRVGQLFKEMKNQGIVTNLDKTSFVNKLADVAIQVPAAQYAQNGYWADHWTYHMDLIDNYITIFPDMEKNVLFNTQVPFYMSPAYVRPRRSRYSLANDATGMATIRSYGAVSSWNDADFPMDRVNALLQIYNDPAYVADVLGAGGAWQRTVNGSVFTVNVASKLFMLASIKFSTLDPFGMGIEMEGGKPGWNDAMNGLPGLIGSGMPETYELIRMIVYLKKIVERYEIPLVVPTEFNHFFLEMVNVMNTVVSKSASKHSDASFRFWDLMNTARETYRASIIAHFDGLTQSIAVADALMFLNMAEQKLRNGVAMALERTANGMSPTYFYYECHDFETVQSSPLIVQPRKFQIKDLPYFLEGPARHFKIVESVEEKRSILNKVKTSTLYDAQLQMYTMSESLAAAPQEVGRVKAFSAGWLENQSVWLHMSYKFYLELLRGHLYEEFFQEIQTGLVPFMDHKKYGRSPLEAASFIVPSCFPDEKIHGTGFLARLSGSTAEFLSMWSIMMAGHEPFYLNANGELELVFRPILPGWLFTDDGTITFTFLGSVLITYHNTARTDTWNLVIKNSVVTDASSNNFYVDGEVFESLWANRIRQGGVTSIDLYFD